MELAILLIFLLLLTDAGARELQPLEDDSFLNVTEDEMSGGNQLPLPFPEKPSLIVLPGDGTYNTFLLVAPSMDSSLKMMLPNINLIMAQVDEAKKNVDWKGSNRLVPQNGMFDSPFSLSMIDFVGLPEVTDTRYEQDNGTINYDSCTYVDVLEYLNLSKNNERFWMSRPVLNHTTATQVKLVMAISAILDVRETDQTFIAYIWIHMVWNNEFIHWNPAQFCDIKHVLIPTNVLWKPDIIIEEMIEKDKAPPSEFLKIRSNGDIEYRNDLVVVSTCKMRVYQFPFDIQRCTISFKSLMHSDEELHFIFSSNTTRLTELSRTVMQTQYEWLFLKMTVTSKTDSISIDSNQTSVIHTIYMKRRSLLYIANFLMPVLFFLCLDLSSFLISDSGGEKLSFKVTVLLAVTVMQLILNEILPCSSERIPLIALFCIGIFTLMMLSLLETILVMHLMEKDAASAQDNETNRDQLMKNQHSKFNIHHCFKEKYGNGSIITDVQVDQTPCAVKEDSRSQLTEVSVALGKVSDELEQIEKSMTAQSEVKKDGYWTRLAKKINKVFIRFYLVAVTMFLVGVFTLWCLPDDEE